MNKHNLNEGNYFSKENSMRYCGSSQFKTFSGLKGSMGCEARAMAELRGEYKRETSTAMLVGQFVDAHFEGTLDIFSAKNPDIFMKNGGLKAEFRHAEVIIARLERDETFMNFMSGEKQVIMTAEFAGLEWKIKMDSYLPDVAIVDLKVMKDIKETFYIKDQGRVNFIEYWDYTTQAAIYQKVVELNTGKRLPFFIAAASKQPEPDLEIIAIEQQKLNAAIDTIEAMAHRVTALKSGEIEPERCGNCDYCRSTKVLTDPIWSEELVLGV